MEPPSAYPLLAIVLPITALLLLSAAMSACELAFFSLDQAQLRQLKERGARRDERVLRLLAKPRRLLATIVITGTIANLGMVLIAARAASIHSLPLPYWAGLLVHVAAVAFVIVLFGEVLPKAYAAGSPLLVALRMSGPVEVLRRVLAPVTELMVRGTDLLGERFAGRAAARSAISVDTLGKALELTDDPATTADEQRILRGIVQFAHIEVRQAMRPRTEVVAFNEKLDFPALIQAIVASGFSRVPVYRDDLDHVVGVLHIKDVLPHLGKKEFDWHKLLRPPYFVPESKKLDVLLKEFRAGRMHMAIAVDEYGGTSGIITLEDVIEEIVGDITDEFDDDDLVYSKLDDRTWLFEGRTPLTDVYRIMGIDGQLFEENKGDSGTLGGFLLELTGRIPRKGERTDLRNFTLVVDSSDNKRVRRVKVIMHDENEA